MATFCLDWEMRATGFLAQNKMRRLAVDAFCKRAGTLLAVLEGPDIVHQANEPAWLLLVCQDALAVILDARIRKLG